MSSKLNIHNLFIIIHSFWVHHTKNWIFLSKQFAHLQMTMKTRRISEDQLFCTPYLYGFTTIQKKTLDPPILAIWTSTNDNEIFNKVSSLHSAIYKEKRIQAF
jgi:hypothetical protein